MILLWITLLAKQCQSFGVKFSQEAPDQLANMNDFLTKGTICSNETRPEEIEPGQNTPQVLHSPLVYLQVLVVVVFLPASPYVEVNLQSHPKVQNLKTYKMQNVFNIIQI